MPRVKIDLVAPTFELPASTGGRVALWDFKGRAPVVLFFAHSDCPACRDYCLRLRQGASRYADHNAQLLAVVPASLADCQQLASELQLPFPVLADADGAVRARYLDDPRSVGLFVLDRYGEPYGRWQAPEATALPGAEPLLSALTLAELECPECGVPDWS